MCKKAAKSFGVKRIYLINDPNDFPGCVYANDLWRGKVFFNRNPNPERKNLKQTYSAICKKTGNVISLSILLK